MAKIGRNERCPCGSGEKYKRCCEDRGKQETPVPSGSMQLVVDTPHGTLVRGIRAAMPPRLGGPVGKSVEAATHGAAATWGLPDFVFRPGERKLGSGKRELGDGLLVAGPLAVVVQVKTRCAEPREADREARWLGKNVKKGLAQARGTIRQLRLAPEPMSNLRGRTIDIDGNDYSWCSVVVIDHPDPPEGWKPAGADLQDAVVLLRRDWEFLFEQLKSTHAVATYLRRVAGESGVLGAEPVRYYELASADADAEPTQLDRRFVVPGMSQFSDPLLPFAPAAHAEDRGPHEMFRSILEDIALTKLRTTTEDRRMRALGELDRLPVAQRAFIGAYLIEKFGQLGQSAPDGISWALRRVSGSLGATQLGFGVCSRFDDRVQDGFRGWVLLRHHEFVARVQPDAEEPMTIGVLLTPRGDPGRPFDTTMCAVAGESTLTEEELTSLIELWHREEDVLAAA